MPRQADGLEGWQRSPWREIYLHNVAQAQHDPPCKKAAAPRGGVREGRVLRRVESTTFHSQKGGGGGWSTTRKGGSSVPPGVHLFVLAIRRGWGQDPCCPGWALLNGQLLYLAGFGETRGDDPRWSPGF